MGGIKGQHVPDRLRRIWHIAEDIAAHPGQRRRALADKWNLSERQIQADLIVIRDEMRLPLVRQQGYRFVSEGQSVPPNGLTLREASVLLAILTTARRDRSIPPDLLDALLGKLPALFSPHIQGIVGQMLRDVDGAPSVHQRIVAALLNAILRSSWVQLGYETPAVPAVPPPTILPEILLPHGGRWYVIAQELRSKRDRVYDISAVIAVTSVVVQTETREIRHVRVAS